VGYSKGSAKEKIYRYECLRTQRSVVNDVMLHLKLQENKNKVSLKLAEEKNNKNKGLNQ
jgi:hypothetical protein